MKPVMKAMKAKKAMKVSKIAKGKLARAVVFAGGKEKTSSGMTKDQLVKSKTGKIVSKKASARAKKAYASSPLKKWMEAMKQARKQLNIKGFVACGGLVPRFWVKDKGFKEDDAVWGEAAQKSKP